MNRTMKRTSPLSHGVLVAIAAITVVAVATAGPPKIFFEGPGTLTFGPQTCLNFVADSGESYPVENTGGFGPGDRVFVAGVVIADSTMCFPVITDAIEDNTISAFVEAIGTITIGPQGCLRFVTDDGDGYFLQNTGGFLPGARVFVTGAVEPESTLCFPVIGAALVDNTIAAYFEGCGELGFGPQGCLAFFPFDQQGIFFLGELDGFGPADLVHVTGVVDDDLILCFPIAGQAIPANTIEACPVDADLNGDGSVNGLDLGLLLAAWGSDDPLADLDGNGTIDGNDLGLLLANWG